ncbi:MAG: hypothetical protein MI922_19990, partial [Bacteroidales bacterium]|nr:hypothetical protein [Bacteroidales bacterium]
LLVGILFYYSYAVFLVYAAGTCLYVLWILFFLRQRKILNNERFKIDTAARELVYDLIDGIRDVKIFNSNAN